MTATVEDSALRDWAQRLRAGFDLHLEFTVGVEEEVLLVDRQTLDLAPRAPELLEELGDPERFHAELSPAQIEIVSPPCTTASDAVDALARGRRCVLTAATGDIRLAGMGAHPFAEPWSDVSPLPRHRQIAARYRWGARQGGLAAGLHVHLGMAGADRVLAVFNALRGHMPQVAALAAGAPFFDSRDTGLASIRPKLADALPRQGVAPAFPTWLDYARFLHAGRGTGSFADYRELWWECRLHPGFGTIEVRVADAQASLEDVAAVATTIEAVGRWLCARHDAGERLAVHPTGWIRENRWRAAADGLAGELIDLDAMRGVPARDDVSRLLDAVQPALTRGRDLDGARRLLEHPHPDEHRRLAAGRGLRGLVEAVSDRTGDV
jgi:carboxylate-amine ligase